ncbi:MAG: hypothetical protein ABIC91_07185 [Nanoarchaeota archaeon]|nr:hypothetical protein [Nanoarchaeota archaeon]MBU1031092.1 hypothetical protein [Nanoarchaeota archaeon]MBU1849689.1 hypothetical protein [Nanoarchaeota archaeon]
MDTAILAGITTLGVFVGICTISGCIVHKNIDFIRELESQIGLRENLQQQVMVIADNSRLHPLYGNNNGIFDNTESDDSELRGVAKDLSVVLERNKKIPYKLAKQYIEMYSQDKNEF